MNKKKILAITLVLTSLFVRGKVLAQSVTGSWLKTSEIVTHADGKTVNTLEKLQKAMPCFAGIVYTFAADGKMSEDASGCPVNVQNTVTSINRNGTWKCSGDKIELDISGNTAPMRQEIFHLRFAGRDEMVWTFRYAENPGILNPLKTKEMVTTYRRK